jgi:3-phosphoglycerate kinase
MNYLSKANDKEIKNKTCLLRVDFNLKSLKNYFRVDAILPTIKFLISQKTKVVILSHRGRPEGSDKTLSLIPLVKILSKRIKTRVRFFDNLDFKIIKDEINSDNKSKIFLLENLRFLPGEENNSSALAKKLADLGDFYVNDAFAVCHRRNASVVAITKYIKSYAGLLLEKEISGLTKATKNPEKPLVVILGGSKIGDKIEIIKNLKNKASYFILGSSIFNEPLDFIKRKKYLFDKKVIFPLDTIKNNGKYFDIGPETIFLYKKILRPAKTIIWNGPVGMMEKKEYARGCEEIARTVAALKAFKVVGGGETANFILDKKLQKKISLLSTGGGAMLDFLAGKKLPGIKALEQRNDQA